LNRLENEALAAIAEGHTAGRYFRARIRAEEQPFLAHDALELPGSLAGAPHPALKVAGPGRLPLWNPPLDLSPWTVTLTDIGRALVAGRTDWIKLNGIDRWLGGVHLGGADIWRWDEQRQCLVTDRSPRRPRSRPAS